MVAFINKLTGSTMYVADSRVNEYLAAGHTVANTESKESEIEVSEEVVEAEVPEEVVEADTPEEKKPRKKSTKEQ